MFGCGNSEFKGEPLFSELYEALMIVVQNIGFHLVVGLNGPVITEGITVETSEVDQPQVMYHVSTANNQHPFTAKLTDLLGQFVMILCRLGVVDTHLNNRDIGLWIEMLVHTPNTMVEPPIIIKPHL